jgi:hypothetical protein
MTPGKEYKFTYTRKKGREKKASSTSNILQKTQPVAP